MHPSFFPGVPERIPTGFGGPFYGVYPAIVVSNKDAKMQGRVKVRLPWTAQVSIGGAAGSMAEEELDSEAGVDVADEAESATGNASLGAEVWARIATMMGGHARGTWFIPEVDDEVLVAFEGGNPRRPYIIGGLWNGVDLPPEMMGEQNAIKSITSRSGLKIMMSDGLGEEAIEIATPKGQKVRLVDGVGVFITDLFGNSINMTEAGIVIESGGNSITVSPEGIVVEAVDDIEVTGAAIVIEAEADLTVNATGAIEIVAEGDLLLNSAAMEINAEAECSISAEASLNLESAADLTIASSGPIEIASLEELTVASGLELEIAALEVNMTSLAVTMESVDVGITGIVECISLTTAAVESAAYTPGLGNFL